MVEGQPTSTKPHETQVMWLDSPHQLAKVNVSEDPAALARITVSKMVCNLGDIVDSQITLSAEVPTVCRSGY